MKNMKRKVLFICMFFAVAFPIYGMKKLFQAKLAERVQQIKHVPFPKGFEPHKKFLTEPWQFTNSAWRKDVLEPTLGSVVQTAIWGSLSYAVGMPIYVIRLDRIANGLKSVWQYGSNYFGYPKK